MMELNNSFFFYVLKRGGGKIDPRNIEFMIEALKEWLPDDTNDIPIILMSIISDRNITNNSLWIT